MVLISEDERKAGVEGDWANISIDGDTNRKLDAEELIPVLRPPVLWEEIVDLCIILPRTTRYLTMQLKVETLKECLSQTMKDIGTNWFTAIRARTDSVEDLLIGNLGQNLQTQHSWTLTDTMVGRLTQLKLLEKLLVTAETGREASYAGRTSNASESAKELGQLDMYLV